jgi:hypothetical protein
MGRLNFEGFVTNQSLRYLISASSLFAVLLLTPYGTAVDQPATSKPCVSGPLAAVLNGDTAQNIGAAKRYTEAIASLLEQERFKELDCIADEARSSKARFSGGSWKLHNIYIGLAQPRLHPTSEDWQALLDLLSKWAETNPASITARIAEAEAYSNFAWEARGEETADTVSESGWRLYKERSGKAEQILMDAAKLRNKCPEWFVAMQEVARAQSWDVNRMNELLKNAMAYEPKYYYFYRIHANLLLPKWFGEEGDTERFVEQIANQIGGKQGDIVYAQLASGLICKCGEEEMVRKLSWPRIQKGYAAIEAEYGMSYINLNSYAYIAVRNADSETANKLFQRIGDQRDEGQWKEKYFQQCKEWAAQMASMDALQRERREAGTANVKTPEGVKYSKVLSSKLTDMMTECRKDSRSDDTAFQLTVKVNENGALAGAFPDPLTATANCVIFYASKAELPVPPAANYWVTFAVNPKTSAVDLPEQGR